jgi:hypothetical protein
LRLVQGADSYTTNGDPIFYQEPSRTPLSLDYMKLCCSRIYRYNGGLEWRLIQHLALCSTLTEKALPSDIGPLNYFTIRAQAACHDLHEVYVGDVVTGLKRLLPNYMDIEMRFERHVHNFLNVPYPSPHSYNREQVKKIDIIALLLEMKHLNHAAFQFQMDRSLHLCSVSITPDMDEIFHRISLLTYDECWDTILNSFQVYHNLIGAKNEIDWSKRAG